MRSIPFLIPLFAGLVALARPVLASDGVLEINQTCAVQTGCFPGDEPGFPVTLSGGERQSYRLTGNLRNLSTTTSTILITAPNVMLDLGGFEIRGPNTCSDSPVTSCSATGFGDLVTNFPGASQVVVRNGSLRGAPSHGVSLSGDGHLVEDLRITESGSDGLRLFSGMGGIVRRVVAGRNLVAGIEVEEGSLVVDSTAFSNGQRGIEIDGNGSVIRSCVARGNGSDGLEGSGGAMIMDSASNDNGGAGIRCGSCRVAGNNVFLNAGFGILDGGSSNGYSDNVIIGNAGGTVSGGFDLGGNLCERSTTCP